MKPIIAFVLVFGALSLLSARSQSERSVWDGVYTEGQAARGLVVFTASCASCHSPAEFSGDAFLGAWEASTALDLFSTMQSKMPMDNPGSLKPEEYADVIAYFFRGNAFPAGKEELTTDREQLKLIRIERKK
jgi:mono/diheme cytochrome c family protein